jgi:hypothetical protein
MILEEHKLLVEKPQSPVILLGPAPSPCSSARERGKGKSMGLRARAECENKSTSGAPTQYSLSAFCKQFESRR